MVYSPERTVGKWGEESQDKRKKDSSPGMHFNSLNCPILQFFFFCCCFDGSDALHIFTLQAQRMCAGEEPVCVRVCFLPSSIGVLYSTTRDEHGEVGIVTTQVSGTLRGGGRVCLSAEVVMVHGSLLVGCWLICLRKRRNTWTFWPCTAKKKMCWEETVK